MLGYLHRVKQIKIYSSNAMNLKSREVLLRALGGRVHGSITRLPTGRADLVRVRLDILKSLENTESLIDRATERQVVDGRVLDNTFLVNDEKSTKSNTISSEDLVSF